MPIYVYLCPSCDTEDERVQNIGEDTAFCECGAKMQKLPTFPAMVKMKGEGGYPSRRKFCDGTAPYTTTDVKPWLDSNPTKLNWLSSGARKRQLRAEEVKHLVKPSRQVYK